MAILGSRRTLGPINVELGGDPNPSGSAGGGGDEVTINNNVDGYLLRAVGINNTISGMSDFTYDGSSVFTLDGDLKVVGGDLKVSGSSNNLFIQGSDSDGNLNVLHRIEVSGGIFKATPI